MKTNFIGWTRSRSGIVVRRHLRTWCNAITSFAGHDNYKDACGMGSNAPYLLIEHERK